MSSASDSTVWRTADGRKIPYKNMGLEHLINALNQIERGHSSASARSYLALKEEAKLRKINYRQFANTALSEGELTSTLWLNWGAEEKRAMHAAPYGGSFVATPTALREVSRLGRLSYQTKLLRDVQVGQEFKFDVQSPNVFRKVHVEGLPVDLSLCSIVTKSTSVLTRVSATTPVVLCPPKLPGSAPEVAKSSQVPLSTIPYGKKFTMPIDSPHIYMHVRDGDRDPTRCNIVDLCTGDTSARQGYILVTPYPPRVLP